MTTQTGGYADGRLPDCGGIGSVTGSLGTADSPGTVISLRSLAHTLLERDELSDRSTFAVAGRGTANHGRVALHRHERLRHVMIGQYLRKSRLDARRDRAWHRLGRREANLDFHPHRLRRIRVGARLLRVFVAAHRAIHIREELIHGPIALHSVLAILLAAAANEVLSAAGLVVTAHSGIAKAGVAETRIAPAAEARVAEAATSEATRAAASKAAASSETGATHSTAHAAAKPTVSKAATAVSETAGAVTERRHTGATQLCSSCVSQAQGEQ